MSLAKLMLSPANFLILDEPTNHLDIQSKGILEDAIRSYTGTVFVVSHDRYFINRIATRILELKDEQLYSFIGNYDYYLEKSEELTQIYAPEQSGETAVLSASASSSSREDWARKKEEQAKKQSRSEQKDESDSKQKKRKMKISIKKDNRHGSTMKKMPIVGYNHLSRYDISNQR